MDVHFVHFPEDPGVTSYGETKWAHQFMAMYGYELHDDYAAALVSYPDHDWVYMDPNSTTYLANIPLTTDTVYVFGHDEHGWEGIADIHDKQTAKLAMKDEHSIHALVAVIAVANYRWYNTP